MFPRKTHRNAGGRMRQHDYDIISKIIFEYLEYKIKILNYQSVTSILSVFRLSQEITSNHKNLENGKMMIMKLESYLDL